MINQINNSKYCDPIFPISGGVYRPLWSVMIPTYNCANYLRETLASVLAQDPGSEIMQIEVVDDHSTKDDPEAVVKELGGDRVSFYRQPENVGYIKNFNTCLERSQGKIVHLLHGDDYVLNGFYSKMQQLFEKHPETGAAFCRHVLMNHQGHWQSISRLEQPESGILGSWLEQIASGQRLTTPSIVVKREAYEKLGGYDSRFTYTGEDWEMYVRIATNYSVAYEVEPLAIYRFSQGSLSQNSVRSGLFFQDLRLANEIIQSYLPNHLYQKDCDKISLKAKETYANWAIINANETLNTSGDVQVSLVQIKESIKSGLSFKIGIKLTLALLKITFYQFKQIRQSAR
ncbi:MAG: glycosyltransferase [Dolichospermum sp. BR01]|nr:glycosyltransferase [Dolichospermum sp. BR01]